MRIELVGKNEQPNYITAHSCVGLVYCSDTRLFQFVQYLVPPRLYAIHHGIQPTVVPVKVMWQILAHHWYCPSFSSASESLVLEGEKLELNNWVSYTVGVVH
jgi:hypothetical protein